MSLCISYLQLPTEALLNHVLEAPGLHEWFEGATESGNPDALLLALKIGEKNSVDSARLGNLLPDPFSPNKLFSADHLSSLANCLKVLWVCAVVWPSVCGVLIFLHVVHFTVEKYIILLSEKYIFKHFVFFRIIPGIHLLSATHSQCLACSSKYSFAR